VHIFGSELEIYLADLKNQADNLRLLLVSMEADLAKSANTRNPARQRTHGLWHSGSAQRRSKGTPKRRSGRGGSS
jgi:hypothetical protein